jgi:hypothetical protein
MEDWKIGRLEGWGDAGLEYGSIGVLRVKDWALQLGPPIHPSNLPTFQLSNFPTFKEQQ